MKAISKTMLGAGATALAAISFATPAEAQYRDRYRDRGVDIGDIISGVAVIGGIAAVASAIGRDGYGSRYRGGYNYAVQACGQEAQRMSRGAVQITDIDRVGNDRYRVRGVVQAGYGGGYGYDRGDRYDRGYGGYNGYTRRGYGEDFTCTARGNGRITDFRL
ncbi:MAG TPA: hypothetical protein VF605_12260 [Allosphingosinicella sp.]|jgi:hypothetical protein